MSEATEQFWAGGFGDEYLSRNKVDWKKRIPFWQNIHVLTGMKSAIEFGCNAGWNLRAIDEGCFHEVKSYGCDVNEKSLEVAKKHFLPVLNCRETSIVQLFGMHGADLVFTAGVLIHIPPDNLRQIMCDIVMVSRRWVLAIEYDSDKEVMIPYRGYDNRLWKRPYGDLYCDMGLKMVSRGTIGPEDGFGEGCTWWLLEKKT